MSQLRQTIINRALYRANLVLGGERNLVIFTGALFGGLVVSAQNLLTSGVCLVLWFFILYCLRLMAKADPKLSEVYRRYVNYGKYYPARSSAWSRGYTCKN